MSVHFSKRVIVVFSMLIIVGSSVLLASLLNREEGSMQESVVGGNHTIDRDDGVISEGENLSALNNDHPAIAKLNPQLRDAIQQAARDAQSSGVEFYITSGWRSKAYQQDLFDKAVINYHSSRVHKVK